ncbi:site-specific DNA-methyltransferase [Nannocystis pusilla]|uniref:site-specific DNA-methyltransferase (adenine-specific) n=1 Tax=Nannocystis pusilla TaxID=889268 RepID=A0ABS7TMH2_9BACT|nr:DNA methyltransferase [Nannocystis pusilla]MBZ5709423.1 hypothetical protein [Nannocystis pusilla]
MPRRTTPTEARVELTWPGKVAPPAVPVAVEPLVVRERVGEPDAWADRLVWGDNSHALAALHAELGAAVDLVYIDPPFDVGTSHYLRKGEVEVLAYCDTWGGPAYLSMLYPRLSLLRALMKPSATIVVHVGIQVCHHVRVVMDEVFGADNFINQVAWKRYSAHNDASQGARRLGAVHDVLLFYGMSQTRTWTTLRAPYDKDYVAKWYRHVEPGTGRRFMSSPLTAPGGAAKGNPNYEFLGVPRFWRYGQATMEALHSSGRVYQSRPGAVPRQKHYLDEQEGVPLQDVWADIRALQGTHVERVGYDTQKPEALLERIVHMCSRPGDLVLDAFSGSGTTAAVAARCGRRWVAIDRSQPAFTVSRRRLRALTRSGEAGPFVVLDAAPAMRRGLVERVDEAELRRRVLALHGATAWSEGQLLGATRWSEGQPSGATTCSEGQLDGATTWPEGQLHGAATSSEGQLHGRRGEAAVVVAAPEERPTAADIAGWLGAARAAGAAALEVIAWTFDPSAHDVDAPAVTLWEIPRAFAEGEEARPTRAPRLSLVVEATPAGRTIRITNYAAVDSDGNWAQLGVDALVEWALDDRGDAAVFAPRWSTQRGRDGVMPLVSQAIAGEGRVVIEAVDVAGRISTRAID